jgi:RNA polymerase sigma-70 factor (ECF subfamily)
MNESLDVWFAREILVHEEALVRCLIRVCSDRNDIQDLRQETYVRVYEAAAKARPRAAKSYLFTTARHLIADRIRRQRLVSIEARGDLEALNVLVNDISPERQVSAYQELRSLARALERLPKRCREVVWLRRVEELSQRDVAARLGIGEGMVEKHVAKAMRRLANDLFGGRALKSTERSRVLPASEVEYGKQHND